MNILRRFCFCFRIASRSACASLGVGGKVASFSPRSPTRAYVGNLTLQKTSSKGIYEFDFDPATGKMSVVQVRLPKPKTLRGSR